MKSLAEYLYFNTKTRRAYINITARAEDLARKSGYWLKLSENNIF